MKKQVRFPDHPIISFENNLLADSNRSNIFLDLINKYTRWKVTSMNGNNDAINPVIWNNDNFVPPLGRKLWNSNLISRGIYYLTDFLGNNHTLLEYREFPEKWDLFYIDISIKEYQDIQLAIRCNSASRRVISGFIQIDEIATLKFFDNSSKPVRGREIRAKTNIFNCPNELAPLKAWTRSLGKSYIDWVLVLLNCYNISNNFKLVQFQYKLLMRISTCRYMRFKMMIAPSNICIHCNLKIETLEHIFLDCTVSKKFKEELNLFINSNKIHKGYKDTNGYYWVTCNHSNHIINYLNLVAKWYLSRCYQTEKVISWYNFTRIINKILYGEKKIIRDAVTALL